MDSIDPNLRLKIKWNEIFEIVPDKGGRKKNVPIWRLKFKNSNEPFSTYAFRREDSVIPFMERWIKNNEQKANDIVFEIEVLQKETE